MIWDLFISAGSQLPLVLFNLGIAGADPLLQLSSVDLVGPLGNEIVLKTLLNDLSSSLSFDLNGLFKLLHHAWVFLYKSVVNCHSS